MKRASTLVLADGTTFAGTVMGSDAVAVGEAVFTTPMTGYQEVLTDPSYVGQLVTFTSVEIGNVGVNVEDHESLDDAPKVSGLIVRNSSPVVSNHRANEALESFLLRHRIPGIAGVDTRALTARLREHGAQNAAFGPTDADELCALARKAPPMEGLSLVSQVTCPRPTHFSEGCGFWGVLPARPLRHRVAVLDFGIKRNILRTLVDVGCDVTLFPAHTDAREIFAFRPDGVFLSNGPGDPSAVTEGISTIRELLGHVPLFGICLGHQLLALALGGQTYKLRFGHRGVNQPVKDLASGRVEITAQNHGFCVDQKTLPPSVHCTHIHLNDGTSEGLALPEASAMSVQYHPEAAAGPHDSMYLFERFVRMMDDRVKE